MSSSCQICGKPCTAPVKTIEPRYFHGEGKICPTCWALLIVNNYDELDKLAMRKIIK